MPDGQSAAVPSSYPSDLPFEPDAPVRAAVKPACVPPSGSTTLTARVTPKSAVAYQVIYADGQSGSAPPFGAGYGGNDSGVADENGLFRSTFTVGADAPRGAASIDVYVNDAVGGWGFARVPLRVASREDC